MKDKRRIHSGASGRIRTHHPNLNYNQDMDISILFLLLDLLFTLLWTYSDPTDPTFRSYFRGNHFHQEGTRRRSSHAAATMIQTLIILKSWLRPLRGLFLALSAATVARSVFQGGKNMAKQRSQAAHVQTLIILKSRLGPFRTHFCENRSQGR